ncbi:MAG: hypothetical protein GX222_06505 [Ruminococcaceae bacterium]|nr:hypothetical protein [Oscillospiraceae bacterium]
MKRILLLNPNSTKSVTERISKTAKRYDQPGFIIETITCEDAPSAIETSYDELMSGKAVVDELSKREFDAAAICCFSDPGLLSARELFSQPIVGICQAAVNYSALFSRRFSIIASGGSSEIDSFINQMKSYQAGERLASVEYLDTGVLGVTTNSDEISERIEKCIKDHGVGAVLLGCAAFSGLSEKLSAKHKIFVSEGVGPAILTLVSLMNFRESNKGWLK